MGQYREWLHYREVGQQLQEQRAMLEHALTQLQEQVHQQASQIESTPTSDKNTIIQALNHHYQYIQQQSGNTDVDLERHLSQQPAFPTTASFSPGETDTDRHTHYDPHTNSQLTLDDHPHGQTDPQLKVPWWLRDMHNASNTRPATLIDQQSQRTNRLVERWFERWKDTSQTKDSQLKRIRMNRQEDERQ